MYGKYISAYTMQRHITKVKKLPEYKHWYQLNSQAIQDIAERIDRAYKLFFQNHKKGIRSAPPNFKRRSKYKSFTLKQTGYKLLKSNQIKIGKIVYRYFKSRDIEGEVKRLTVKRDRLGDIYLFFVVDMDESREAPRTGEIVGFDFGLKTYLTASNGEDVESPLFFKQRLNDIRKANRSLSRKKRGSNNRHKARLNLARLHKKLADQRKDFQFKLANRMTDEYDVMVFETLNMKAMQRLWGRKVSDLGFASFLNILKYLASIKNKRIILIDRFEPSSKTCSICGYVNHELNLSMRSWQCPQCRTQHHRDRNASYNILRVGASTLGLGDVRPALQAVSA
jgi:putative transposase